VQRQYTGTADKIDNAQVAVYLTYASQHGHAVIDRELNVSRRWIADADRRAAAGVPEHLAFATKPELGGDDCACPGRGDAGVLGDRR
jgi:SRSO17 transposase